MAARATTMHETKRTVSRRLYARAAGGTRFSGLQDRPVLVLVVQNAPCASHDARERILVDVNRKIRFLAQKQIQSTNQRATARHDDAAIDDVARELGWRDLERTTHRVDDLLNRLLNRFANLARVHAHGLRNAGDEIASLHFHFALFAHRRRGADLNLDLLGRRLADEEI